VLAAYDAVGLADPEVPPIGAPCEAHSVSMSLTAPLTKSLADATCSWAPALFNVLSDAIRAPSRACKPTGALAPIVASSDWAALIFSAAPAVEIPLIFSIVGLRDSQT